MHNQAFHQIHDRIERFPKKLGVIYPGCVSHRHGHPPSPLTCIFVSNDGAVHPSRFVFICALPKLYNFSRFLDLRVFAGFCGRFADSCGRFAGNFGRSYVHLCVGARDMRVAWYFPGTQPGCKPCSIIFNMSIVGTQCGHLVATGRKTQAN